MTLLQIKSLPSWERGLKYPGDSIEYTRVPSLPSWERGLKLQEQDIVIENE